MERLPFWVLNHKFPSTFDSESKTVIEQTARVYGAMQTLIDEYNAFVQATNTSIEAFEKGVQDSICEFKTGITCLLENYIKSIDQKVNEAINNMAISSGSSRIGYVTLSAEGWSGSASPYSQVVDIEGVTENTQVDLTPSVEQLAIFHEKDLAFVTENNDGVVTVYAVGQKPTNSYTIQATLTEVIV